MSEGTRMLEQVNDVMGRILICGEETSWDYGFLESITSQLAKGYTLSPKQERSFQQIQGRWSDEAIKIRASWTQDWDDEKEEKFLIALRYYDRTGYYGNITGKYLKYEKSKDGVAGVRSGGTPTMKEYNKIVENKYASAVIRNLKEEPKFAAGEGAVFRANVEWHLRGKTCVVLKYGGVEKVRSHAKGAKPVQVLIIGHPTPVWTEERRLKKAKKRK
jgi:hypothetical protein